MVLVRKKTPHEFNRDDISAVEITIINIIS